MDSYADIIQFEASQLMVKFNFYFKLDPFL